MREIEREREREDNSHAVFHSIFVVAFIFLVFFSLLYVQYKYSGFVTKLTSSAVMCKEVSSG